MIHFERGWKVAFVKVKSWQKQSGEKAVMKLEGGEEEFCRTGTEVGSRKLNMLKT